MPQVFTENSKSGPARACTFDTLNVFRSLDVSPILKTQDRVIDLIERERALPPMTAAV